MKYVSLEYYRGLAALGVAVFHFFSYSSGEQVYEFASLIFVEMFFPLSGFVLARQMLFVVEHKPQLTIFLMRRWMRTIPLFVLALLSISVLASEVGSFDFFQYLFFLKYLSPALLGNDYYPIVWSLAVEEWYYVVFPLILIALHRTADRKALLLSSGAFIAAIFLVKFILLLEGNVQYTRIATLGRLDSIAFGFLFFILIERQPRTFRYLVLLCVLSGLALGHSTFVYYVTNSFSSQLYFLYASSIFFSSAVSLLYLAEKDRPYRSPAAFVQLGLWMGRISYSMYLFHLLIILLLSRFGALDNIFLYLAVVVGVCVALFYAFESPILKARPGYRSVGGLRDV